MVKLQVRHSIPGTLDYFADDPALSDRERQGIWLGRGAVLTGLEHGARIRLEDLACFLHGFSPSGQRLFSREKENRRCAWDCVVTAQKSASVAALCSNEAASVRAAFLIAVMRLLYHLESLSYRQDNAATGKAQPTGNVIAALYVHEASRHSDPHIHAHLLLMNTTYGTAGEPRDRRWRSLEPANMYRNQKALRWVFNAELNRQFRLHGLRSEIGADGITRLPVPHPICVQYSRAHAAIGKLAAELLRTQNIPPEWERMKPPELINRLNDRSRPSKRPPLLDWQQLLSPEVKAQLSEALIDPQARHSTITVQRPPQLARFGDHQPFTPPPPPPRTFGDPDRYEDQATELLGQELAKSSLYFSPQAIKIETCRTAARHPDIPIGAFARAAHWWSQHRPRIRVFSRAAASTLEEISRHLGRSRANHDHAQPLARVEGVKSLT
jgi:conjugative relaxase-like TrwC/TraI family protein